MTDQLKKYFPEISNMQYEQLNSLLPLYRSWNQKINVVSRKDIDNLMLHHVVHSLCLAKIVQFRADSSILDVGTGGGFPGIPLAIVFPEANFTLLDSVGKKLKVVKAVSESIGLRNVTIENQRVEKYNKMFDFVVSRAVTKLPVFYSWVKSKIKAHSFNDLRNGIFYWKGGDFEDELNSIKHNYKVFTISNYFDEEFFKTKKLVYISF